MLIHVGNENKLQIFDTIRGENSDKYILKKAWCAAYIGIGGMKIEDEPRH